MDEVKRRLYDTVDARLAAAPDSTAKTELVEELSDNLYSRYLDMTASGMEAGEAYRKALDELGDTGELVDYLKGLAPDEPLPKLVLHPEQGTASQLDDLFRDVEAIVSGALDRAKNAVMEVKENLKETGAFDWKSDNGNVEVHIRKDSDDSSAAEAEAEKAECEAAEAELEAAEAEFEAAKADSEASEAEFEAAEADFEAQEGHGWEFSVGFDPHENKFFAGGGPKAKDEVYGFGYDKAKGGFYAQWGDEKSRQNANHSAPADGPIPSDALRGIEVFVDGDVTIRMVENPDGDVVIDGDLDDLEVRRSDNGVLTIRQGKTASSSFFFLRGLSSADVDLSLPRRHWGFLNISSSSGDVEIDGDGDVGLLSVKTTSGDLTGQLSQARSLVFKSISGDLEWDGDADEVQVETVSGDITFATHNHPCSKLLCKSTSGDLNLDGDFGSVCAQTASGDITLNARMDSAQVSTMSGEIELAGSAAAVRCSSTSGNVRVESEILPQHMELSSKSGDCEARIPDTGPFTVNFKTTSGAFRSDFFAGTMGGRSNSFNYQGGENGPSYRFSSISGNLYLYKY